MVEKKLFFAADGLKLSGVVHLPERSPKALIVGVHGLLSDKSSPKQITLAKNVNRRQMAYFRFDHRGCGESEGSFNTQTTLANREADLIAATRAAREILGPEIPVGLFGSSLGGTICLKAAGQIAPFALVTLAAPVRSRSIQIPDDSPDSLRDEILGNRLRFDIKEELSNIGSILIIHGSADATVPADNAETIYRLAKPPKEKIVLENGDHRVSDPQHQTLFIKAATDWFAKCCQQPFEKQKGLRLD